jgi:hypothetical protein
MIFTLICYELSLPRTGKLVKMLLTYKYLGRMKKQRKEVFKPGAAFALQARSSNV